MGKPKLPHYSPEGARWSFGFALSSLAWGFAFGAAATSKLSVGIATVMSALLFSGTAQLMIIELWSTPLPLVTMLLAVVSINSRYIAMGATLAPLYAGRSKEGLATTAFLTDASWSISLRAEREGLDPRAALVTSTCLLWICWVVGTMIGAVVGDLMPPILLEALAWLVLALLATIIVPLISGVRTAIGPAVAAAAAVSLDIWIEGSWHVLAAGLAGGAATFIIGKNER